MPIAIPTAGKQGIFDLNQKSYFPAPYLGTQTADVGRPRLEDKELLSNISVARVSVLDLDNSVRFSRQTLERPRKQSGSKARLSCDKHLTEIIPLLRAIKQC